MHTCIHAGECQQFHELPEGTDVRLGDALDFRCRYDNKEGVPIHYGLSAAQEMCGLRIVHEPHVNACMHACMWVQTTGRP